MYLQSLQTHQKIQFHCRKLLFVVVHLEQPENTIVNKSFKKTTKKLDSPDTTAQKLNPILDKEIFQLQLPLM